MNSNTNTHRRTCRHARPDDMPTHCLWYAMNNPEEDRCAPCREYDDEMLARFNHAREVRRQREAERAVPPAGRCPGGFNGDDGNPNCTGRTAEGNNYGLCESCEYIRRQVALDEIFIRHNMSVTAGVAGEEPETILGGGSASGGLPQRVIIERCERCRRDIYDDEQAYTQRTHTVREEDGEPMVEDLLVCSDCDRGNARALANATRRVVRHGANRVHQVMPAIQATVVQPAVEATAVAPAPQAHDDCCVCMDNDATSWSRLMCGHEVCTPCLGQLQRGDITSRPSPDRYQIGECPNDVICPMCRAPSGNTDPVELHQRLDKYRKRLITIRDEHSRIARETLTRHTEDINRERRRGQAEAKRWEDRWDAQKLEIETLKRQLAEAQARQRPAKACDGCSNPQEDDRVPYCNGCMSTLYGENWARDNGLEQPAQKVGGGGGRAEAVARPEEPRVVIPRHQPAVMVGGGGGGPTPRRPCRCPDCETPKPTQRRCDGRTCRANNRDTPCCKRCQYCPACR